jgi:hypothetical protein
MIAISPVSVVVCHSLIPSKWNAAEYGYFLLISFFAILARILSEG